MKLIFMGTPDFAVPSLVKLHQSNHQIVAVVTGPDKAVGRGQKIRETPVKLKARELGIPMLTPEKLSDASFVEQLQRYGADLFRPTAPHSSLLTSPTSSSFQNRPKIHPFPA